VKLAIKKYWKDFAAVIVLIVIAMGVSSYILVNQRFSLPAWFPGIGKDVFLIKADMQTAQAVTPGQGQTVSVAGVPIGEIAKVELEDGKAVITFALKQKYKTVYKDATVLLRPKTGLKDMVAELTPGTKAAGLLEENEHIPIQNTLPDVNLDEILATLDKDTRDYLQLLVGGAAEGLRGGNGTRLGDTFRTFEPLAKDVRAINEQLATRKTNIKRVIHNLSLIFEELGSKDQKIGEFVTNSNAVFSSFAAQDQRLREALQELPPTLTETQSALASAKVLGDEIGPTLDALRPGARALGPTLRQVRPFLRDSIPIIRDKIRPFVRAANPTVTELRPAMRDLAAATPALTNTFKIANYALDMLAYNPPGENEEGYLFWLSWANHLGATVFQSQDGNGPIRHGVFVATCNSFDVLDSVAQADPRLGTLVGLLNPPRQSNACPKSAQDPDQGGGTGPTGPIGAINP
jgi:phospholipid/cholesterol/gamma-HCH transport system substrate-binding protein